MQYNFSINNRLSRSTSIHRRVHRSDDRGSNGIVCRPSDGRELMIGHRASHRAERVSVGVRNPVAAVHRREQSGGRGMAEERKKQEEEKGKEKERAKRTPKSSTQITRPPLMRGFGRHTSKVIAYLRDQVRPPRRSLNSSLPYRRGGMGQPRKERKREEPCLSRSN